MIKDFRVLQGAKVLEFESGDSLATVSGVIVDPDTGAIEGFWVKPITLGYRNAILKAADILEIKKYLYIKSDKVLAQADDLIRISEILQDRRTFLGSPVQNEAGNSYGKCISLSFDTKTFLIKQIFCRRSFLGLITLDERIFSYNNILRVLPDMILVSDDSTEKEPLMATTPEAAAG